MIFALVSYNWLLPFLMYSIKHIKNNTSLKQVYYCIFEYSSIEKCEYMTGDKIILFLALLKGIKLQSK